MPQALFLGLAVLLALHGSIVPLSLQGGTMVSVPSVAQQWAAESSGSTPWLSQSSSDLGQDISVLHSSFIEDPSLHPLLLGKCLEFWGEDAEGVSLLWGWCWRRRRRRKRRPALCWSGSELGLSCGSPWARPLLFWVGLDQSRDQIPTGKHSRADHLQKSWLTWRSSVFLLLLWGRSSAAPRAPSIHPRHSVCAGIDRDRRGSWISPCQGSPIRADDWT